MNIKAQVKKLPDAPGIYQFFDQDGNLIYVGKAISLKKRVASYLQNRQLGAKGDLLVKKIAKISFIKVFSEFEALLLEAQLIKKNQPFFNSIAKDDKSPLYIKITNDQIPLITTQRKKSVLKGEFIKGPFPSTRTTRQVLKIIRRIFPFCHHKNPKSACLYVHLGLCPFPYESQAKKGKYKKNILRIKKLLSGKTKNLTNDLKKEMIAFSNKQEFETADAIKQQISKIEYITTTYHTPSDFLENPTLVDDLSAQRLKNLRQELNLEKIPKRIECFDVSNISGKLATGSMVVFINGQSDKSEYRRFKIKFTKRPNDYQMLEEILKRRYRNSWKIADLTIIDGGRGHLNTALRVKNRFKIRTKVIALAKRLEQIYTEDKVLPISLPKESPARQLVQALRDEAHRFAITYHRLLRSKQLLSANY